LDLRGKLYEGILVGNGALGTLLADCRIAQPPARHRFKLDAHDLDVASGGERDRSGYLETRSRMHSSARRGSTVRETDKA
jgi:hypothetical protein